MPFPKKDAEVDSILQIWADRLKNHAVRYGLTDELTEQVETDSLVFHHNIVCAALLENDRAEFYAYKHKCANGDTNGAFSDFPAINLPAPPAPPVPAKPGIIPRNTEIYNFLKNHPNRTEESLADLGITTANRVPIPPENLKPNISGKPIADDRIELSFNKQNQSAIRFQMRRGSGEWNSVGDPTSSPFIDASASLDGKPEKREYRAIYINKNEPAGQYSDIITVYTTP